MRKRLVPLEWRLKIPEILHKCEFCSISLRVKCNKEFYGSLQAREIALFPCEKKNLRDEDLLMLSQDQNDTEKPDRFIKKFCNYNRKARNNRHARQSARNYQRAHSYCKGETANSEIVSLHSVQTVYAYKK